MARRSWFLWLYVAGGVVGRVGVVAGIAGSRARRSPSPPRRRVCRPGRGAFLLENRSRGLRAKRLPDGLRGYLAVAAISAGDLVKRAAYHYAGLAPYTEFRELQHIGQTRSPARARRCSNKAPASTAPVHSSTAWHQRARPELRRRTIRCSSGQSSPKGDTRPHQFELSRCSSTGRSSPAPRRSPAGRRSPDRLVYVGRWYEVWQRPTVYGDPCSPRFRSATRSPDGVPDVRCGAAPRPQLATAALTWRPLRRRRRSRCRVPSPLPEGDTLTRFTVPAPGRYEVWLGGSFIRRLQVYVDGARVASWHEQLNEAGQWTPLGTARLRAGTHRLRLAYGDAALYPGSGGPGAAGPFFAVGPLALAPVPRAGAISYVEPAAARSLCGRRWDWIEALG